MSAGAQQKRGEEGVGETDLTDLSQLVFSTGESPSFTKKTAAISFMLFKNKKEGDFH